MQALYEVLLNRTGIANDVTGWVNLLPTLGTVGVAQAFLTGQEFRTDAFEGYYNVLLHRPDDAAGLHGWVVSNLSLGDVRTGFESSNEFFTVG